jgi:glucose-6-phosphate 1-dehydrogenase
MFDSTPFLNPLIDTTLLSKIPDPCILVIFGATGDLTARKLMPALYNLARDGQLPPHFACVAFARREKSNELFRAEMFEAISQFSRSKPIDPELWKVFQEQIFYHQSEFHDDKGYKSLKSLLEDIDKKFDTKGNRAFYLSTQPSFFPLIVQKLSENGLIYDTKSGSDKWSRIIIEKPFGHDLNSALMLQQELTKYLDERQIYRIDHWLGKETVQNLLIFRFSNSIFESLWDRHHIDHVQITVAEELGIGTRGHFWEEAGMLRDIVQNHVMQLLTLVAMEPPINLTSQAIREEKVKVLQSIRPLVFSDTIRGQYGKGYINGDVVKGYREEDNVSTTSSVETYAALKLYIDNWRWSGVPFYIRAGKRMPKRVTEIAITFKSSPGYLFSSHNRSVDPNVLILRIQPDEGIYLKNNCKIPGLSNIVQPVKMDFRYSSYFGSTPPEAYERLICDCMTGDNTLFARDDEVMTSWKLLTPILEHWNQESIKFPNYPAGSWGPESSEELFKDSGKYWRLI